MAPVGVWTQIYNPPVVSAELKVILYNDHGKMLSIVTGRATVSAPRGNVRLAELREQALTETVFGMTRSLQSQLERATSWSICYAELGATT